ncbi:MFS transporter [Nocardia neocaledoniensis]|uniref:MFS transporter n=1 Tax=Nocardia neocaledoniensis TaxID=236511 RepID=UPI0024544434|nr:MFS transporter [Nocardia neocaledoniensis]
MTTTATQRNEGGAGLGARYTLLLISLIWPAQLLSVIGLLGGNAQAQIAIHFQTTQVAWFSLSAALVGTFMTPFIIKAADLFGKRRIMIVITVLGLVGDLIAALAPSYAMLLLGKGISGFYVPMAALVFAIARDVFPKRSVGPASGMISGSVGLVALGGPFLSGWLLDNHGFRGVLWFLVGATAVSLIALIAFVPESPVRNANRSVDWLGGLLLGAGLTAIVYGVGKGGDWGWTAAPTLAYLVGGALAVVVFMVVEGRVREPMFELSLLGRREVWSVLVATALLTGTAYTAGTVTQMLALLPPIPGISDGLGFSATKLAVVGAPASVLIILTAVLTGVLARKMDTRILLAIGAAFVAGGYAMLANYHYSVKQLVVVGIVVGIGTGVVAALAPIMVIEAVRPHEQAMASGMQNMMQGIVTAVVTQLLFVVMACGGTVMQGTQFYGDTGYTNAYYFAAGTGVVSLLAIALIPRIKRLDEAEVGGAALR